jgi:hypothetical protein
MCEGLTIHGYKQAKLRFIVFKNMSDLEIINGMNYLINHAIIIYYQSDNSIVYIGSYYKIVLTPNNKLRTCIANKIVRKIA